MNASFKSRLQRNLWERETPRQVSTGTSSYKKLEEKGRHCTQQGQNQGQQLLEHILLSH